MYGFLLATVISSHYYLSVSRSCYPLEIPPSKLLIFMSASLRRRLWHLKNATNSCFLCTQLLLKTLIYIEDWFVSPFFNSWKKLPPKSVKSPDPLLIHRYPSTCQSWLPRTVWHFWDSSKRNKDTRSGELHRGSYSSVASGVERLGWKVSLRKS